MTRMTLTIPVVDAGCGPSFSFGLRTLADKTGGVSPVCGDNWWDLSAVKLPGNPSVNRGGSAR